MSRWGGALGRRRGGRPTADPGRVSPPGAGAVTGAGEPAERVLVEDHDGLFLLRPASDETLDPADIADLAHTLHPESGTVTIVATVPEGAAGALWPRLSELLDTLHAEGTRSVRLVMAGAGDDRPERPALARRIADAWELVVEAPDGQVLVVPGGSVFVPPGDGGWWRFAPGEQPELLGPRTPAPEWQTGVQRAPARMADGCVVDRIPAGLLIRPAEATASRPGDVFHAIPVDNKRPAVVVGVPWGEDVAASEVAELLITLPAEVRSRVRLAPGGRRDVLRLGQSVAWMLKAEVEVTTGLPLFAAERPLGSYGVRSVLVGADGGPVWVPFVDAVVCPPSGDADNPPPPGLLHWAPSLEEIGGAEDGVVRLSEEWQATATRAGLWVGARDGAPPPNSVHPVSGDGPVIEIGRPGERLDSSLWPVLSRLLETLAPALRERSALHVHATPLDGGRALRGLAADQGLRMIRFVKPQTPRRAPQPEAPTHPEPTPPAPRPATTGGPLPATPRQPERTEPEGRPLTAPAAAPSPGTATSGTATAGAASTPAAPPTPRQTPPTAPRGARVASTTGDNAQARTTSTPAAPDHPAAPQPATQASTTPAPAAPVAPTPPPTPPTLPTASNAPAPQPNRAPTTSPTAHLDPKQPEPEQSQSGGQPPIPTSAADPGARPAAPTPSPTSGSGTAGGIPDPRPDPQPDNPTPPPARRPVSSPSPEPSPSPPSPSPAAGRPLPAGAVSPRHQSTEEERRSFRVLADAAWERHSAAVNRALAGMPTLRGAAQEAARADLIAVRMYLQGGEAPLNHRELTRSLRDGEPRLLPYAACLASGLGRLPSYRGAVLRGPGGTPSHGELRPGAVLRDPAPLSGLPLDPAGKDRVAGVAYAIWSITGRRVRQLLDSGEEIVFTPGTPFRVLDVLDVGTEGATPLVLLRQLPDLTTTSGVLEDADHTALERLRHALKDRTSPDPEEWPERCSGPVGEY
ncbi:hypothetical protein PV396_13595 [Streptomyces sp. ME02-8801-2C]|uniref:hypothetical protein n=1 Tax=Streptomyces sp. ME02-8801-2C TaxID=3028680 RepID=UPI0029BEAA1F|nr:hypothetical protein [Streptomyces sp. ME02-8801-2C]MDX3452972.1 hypothetical protein [Streptomyces sp. ME02-8801-2C]